VQQGMIFNYPLVVLDTIRHSRRMTENLFFTLVQAPGKIQNE